MTREYDRSVALPATAVADPGRDVALLMRVLGDQGSVRLRDQAAALGLPISTAYRMASQLQRAGLISRVGRGYFTIGFELHRLTLALDRKQLLADIARPHLQALARRLQLTAHLGVMEDDMVTYVIKEHGGGPELFTRAGTQLEAYCSAIGKVLLAALTDAELERYLSDGPFIPLTARTISEPERLRQALMGIRAEEFAVDAEEVVENLRCIAMPVRNRHGAVVCAVSVSRRLDAGRATNDGLVSKRLLACTQRIAADL
jgi:IclR family transcriptional regulator, acetate operon repressor